MDFLGRSFGVRKSRERKKEGSARFGRALLVQVWRRGDSLVTRPEPGQNCGLDVLTRSRPGVRDPTLSVQDHDVRRPGSQERTHGSAPFIPKCGEFRRHVFQVPPNRSLGLGDGDGDRNERDSVSITGVRIYHLRMQSLTQLAPACPEFNERRPTSDIVGEAHLVAFQVLYLHQLGTFAQSDPNVAAFLRGHGRGREYTEGENRHEQYGCAHEMRGAPGAPRVTDSVVGFHNTIPTWTK